MSKLRKCYDKQFKRRAVELMAERKNTTQLSKELGVSPAGLYRWKKELAEFKEGSFPGNGNLKQTEEQKKIAELKHALADAQLERDILKKAIGIFSSTAAPK
jgi:transposase